MSSQTTTTQEQRDRIISIFTPKKIIDISKGLSNEKRQKTVISELQGKIDSLHALIDDINEEHKATLARIAAENEIAKEASKEVDEISEDQIKKERLKWSGVHMYIGVEAPEFEFDRMNINSELMYEFRKFEFGLRGQVENSQNPNDTKFNFQYMLKLRYKLF